MRPQKAQSGEASPRRGRKRKGEDDTELASQQQDYSDSDLQQLIAAAEESLQDDGASTSTVKPKHTPQKRTRRQKGQRTSPRVTGNVKCSEPVVNLDEDQDDDKSSPQHGTADTDTTGEQVGTYSFTLHSKTNTARTLQLRDTSHVRALLYPRSAPCLAPSVASTSDWSLVSEAIRQAEAFDDDESPDSIAALLRMIAQFSDVTAQAKDVFKASRLVHLASEEYTPPPDALAITVTKAMPDFVNAWWREFAQKDLAGPEPRQQKWGGGIPNKRTEAHASTFHTGGRGPHCATSRRPSYVL